MKWCMKYRKWMLRKIWHKIKLMTSKIMFLGNYYQKKQIYYNSAIWLVAWKIIKSSSFTSLIINKLALKIFVKKWKKKGYKITTTVQRHKI